MRIQTFGTKNYYTAQLDRIESGFIELGHEIVDNNPDLIFANDPGGFEGAIKCKEQNPEAKLILGIQDVPLHVFEINEWIKKIKEQLKHADCVTSISQTTQINVKEYLGFNSKIIYQPIKSVCPVPETPKVIDFLVIGRNADPNKRVGLLKDILGLPEHKTKIFASCGEYPGFGMNHMGIVSDEILNSLYNASKIVFTLGKIEGICLPVIESLVTSVPIIAAYDNPTAHEFAPPEMICAPDPKNLNYKILEILNNYSDFQEMAQEYGEKYKKMFNKVQIARNILDVYEKNLR